MEGQSPQNDGRCESKHIVEGTPSCGDDEVTCSCCNDPAAPDEDGVGNYGQEEFTSSCLIRQPQPHQHCLVTSATTNGESPHHQELCDKESIYFAEVLHAFSCYESDALREVSRIERCLRCLSEDDQKHLRFDIDDRIAALKKAVATNQSFIDLLLCTYPPEMLPNANVPIDNNPEFLCRNLSKIYSSLRQFVRDWAEEGEPERQASYMPLINALLEYKPLEPGKKPYRVLCPGSGLARLPFEVVRRGYPCQGNEFSCHMLLGSNMILNMPLAPKSILIQPFCLSTSNRKNEMDNLKEIWIPDVCPGDHIDRDQDFSMCAGEFVEVYHNEKQEWDAVLTSYFIDTAKNIILYIRTIANILVEGGLWANLGPLLYHYAEMSNEMSIELSWEEVLHVIKTWFDVKKIEWHDTFYTTNYDSMMQTQYHCVFFIAIRNSVEVFGESNPVYED